jgi:sugar O-acyltransferase (sialic acid O-acetyltransferase NeuD family)
MFYIFGAGGHASSLLDIVDKNFPGEQIILIDYRSDMLPRDDHEFIRARRVIKRSLSSVAQDMTTTDKAVVAVGDLVERRRVVEAVSTNNPMFPTIIARTSIISDVSRCSARGVSIHNRAYIGPEVRIGDFSIINTGAIVEHHVTVGSYSHVAPGAVITGRCSIGSNVFIGAGAVVTNGVRIPDNVTIGAGSVVVRDILVQYKTYIGVPAAMR